MMLPWVFNLWIRAALDLFPPCHILLSSTTYISSPGHVASTRSPALYRFESHPWDLHTRSLSSVETVRVLKVCVTYFSWTFLWRHCGVVVLWIVFKPLKGCLISLMLLLYLRQRSSEVCEARLGESRDQPEVGREQLGQENPSQRKGKKKKKDLSAICSHKWSETCLMIWICASGWF